MIREKDWSDTPLGPIASWPESLLTFLNFCLNSKYPFLLYWGSSFNVIYNDAYIPSLASKHPAALGRPGNEVWSEIWGSVIQPRVQQVLSGEPATWLEDQQVIVCRNGFFEETYVTRSHSPIYLNHGEVGGVCSSGMETTKLVLSERRFCTLGELTTIIIQGKSIEEVCKTTAEVLKKNLSDIPFALIYLLDPYNDKRLILQSTSGITAGGISAPESIDIRNENTWPMTEVFRQKASIIIETPSSSPFGRLPGGPWPESPRISIAIPIRSIFSDSDVIGVLVLGISPRLVFDDEYQRFCKLIADQLAKLISSAKAYEEEKKRSESLAKLDREKTAFFTKCSNEFRTPLTLMLGPIEDALLDKNQELPPEQKERLEIIHRNALRLQKLLNSLLYFSRIETDRVQALFEPTDLSSLTSDLAGTFRPAIERAGMRLIIHCVSIPEPIYVDRTMWKKIVLNLLSNAFKFTFSGEIEVRLEPSGRHVELTVRDTGTGIPEKEIPHLFERFYRVEGTRGRTPEGSGMGLALVHDLVKFHGGMLSVESKLAKGTQFVLSIPQGTAHLRKDRVSVSSEQEELSSIDPRGYVEEAFSWLSDDHQANQSFEVPNTPHCIEDYHLSESLIHSRFEDKTQAQLKKLPQLVVTEINPDMRRYIQKILQTHYDVQVFENVEMALHSINQKPPDLILADRLAGTDSTRTMTPSMDGFALLKEIRSSPELQGIPLIILSAHADEESRFEGLEAGADDYLVKPFSAKELLARISATLEISRLRLAAAEREIQLIKQTEKAKLELGRVLTTLNDSFVTFDRDWRFTFLNAAATTLIGSHVSNPIGKIVWKTFPFLVGTKLHQEYLRVSKEQTATQFEYYSLLLKKWFDIRAYPNPDGISVLSSDISSRKTTEAALLSAIKARDEFLSVASHELRTPLTSLKLQTQIRQRYAIKGDASAFSLEKVKTMLEKDNIQIERLTRLIDDMMDISRISSSKLMLHLEYFDLSVLINEVLERLSPQLEAMGCKTSIQVDEPIVGLWDRYRIEQVLINLLTNAMKYSEQKPLSISLFKKATLAELHVQDQGIGIAKKDQERIFRKFERLDMRSGISGLGLGLFIVRKILDLHHGSIRVESDLGKGSNFIVNLPIVPKKV
jgi:signal transduction histidine kinase